MSRDLSNRNGSAASNNQHQADQRVVPLQAADDKRAIIRGKDETQQHETPAGSGLSPRGRADRGFHIRIGGRKNDWSLQWSIDRIGQDQTVRKMPRGAARPRTRTPASKNYRAKRICRERHQVFWPRVEMVCQSNRHLLPSDALPPAFASAFAGPIQIPPIKQIEPRMAMRQSSRPASARPYPTELPK